MTVQRSRGFFGSFVRVTLLVIVATIPLRAGEPADVTGVLRLTDGGYLAGSLAESDQANQIRWQHPDFDSPFEFAIQSIVGAAFRTGAPDDPARSKLATGEFALKLRDGDRLYGSVVGVDEDSLQFQTQNFGTLSVPRRSIEQLVRWDNGDAVTFMGPGDLVDWKSGEKTGAWRDMMGQLQTDVSGAQLYRKVEIPNHSEIDIELSWIGEPDFVVALGVSSEDPKPNSDPGLSFEVWDGKVVAVWESDEQADIAVIGKLTKLRSGLKLVIDLDQQTQQARISLHQGEQIATLNLGSGKAKRLGDGIRIKNLRGNLSLDSLQVTQKTKLPEPAIADNQRSDLDCFVLNNDTIQRRWISAEPDAWTLVKPTEATETEDEIKEEETEDEEATAEEDPEQEEQEEREKQEQVQPSEVRQVIFATPSDPSPPNQADANQRGADAELQFLADDGTRLSGWIAEVREESIQFWSTALGESITIDTRRIRSMEALGGEPKPVSKAKGSARLELQNTRVRGRIVDSKDDDVLRFEPTGGSVATMQSTASGRLVYRDIKPKPVSEPPPTRRRRPAKPKGFLGVLMRAFGNNENTARMEKPAPKSMRLRSGELIPCSIDSIDPQGVVFESDMTDKTRLPHRHLLSVQLANVNPEPDLDPIARQRLLTVPRNQKNNHPEHLIVAKNGDVMRARLLEMDQEFVRVKTRLETIEINRDVVAQIVWLQHDEPNDASDDAEAGAEDDVVETQDGLFIQAILRDGNRLSMTPSQVQSGVITGTNLVLGQCDFKISRADQILFGNLKMSTDPSLPLASWKLTDAPEPILLGDDGGGDGGSGGRGASSPLVGTAAPDFTLKTLSGDKFTLSKYKGRVVVLDFWATWCGPCLQAMPLIESVVDEFEADDVMLVAVNLQQTADPIRQTLERLEIEPMVVLDIDGVAAGRYEAQAIPQTVVIDREGTIQNLFVGGGPKLEDQLRAAIQAATETP